MVLFGVLWITVVVDEYGYHSALVYIKVHHHCTVISGSETCRQTWSGGTCSSGHWIKYVLTELVSIIFCLACVIPMVYKTEVEYEADILIRDMAGEAVKNMYWELDVTHWTKPERKLVREDQVNQYHDVLLKAYKPVYPFDLRKLHSLVFRPTSDPIRWKRLIRQRHANLTVQWTHRQRRQPIRVVINIQGNPNDLRIFCTQFRNYRTEINEEEIRDLEEGIQGLALEDWRQQLNEQRRAAKKHEVQHSIQLYALKCLNVLNAQMFICKLIVVMSDKCELSVKITEQTRPSHPS